MWVISIDNIKTTHILILTTLAGSNTQIFHGTIRIEMLQHLMDRIETQPPGFHQQNQGQKQISQYPITSLETLIKEYIANNEAIVQSQVVSLRNLENQM